MPGLSRRSVPLLRTVRNKQHATNDDHEKDTGLPSPPATSSAGGSSVLIAKPTIDDYTRSPVSSEEETEDIRPPARVSHLARLSSKTQPKPAAKRKADESDSDSQIFTSSSQAARGGSKSKRITYGSSQTRASQPKNIPKKAFRKSDGLSAVRTPPKKQAAFKVAKDADVFQFKAGSDGANAIDLSPSCFASPSSSPEVVDMTMDDEVLDTSLQIRCPVCNASVDLLLKQEYEDQFHSGAELNIRRQNAFCRFHTQHDARAQWKAKKYPDIDWSGLPKRMQRRLPRLKRIISGSLKSTFRDALVQQLANRSTVSAAERQQARMVDVSAGYYGPRGQHLIAESMIYNLADDLRAVSKTDPLIMAAGTDAGLAGFVQQVLVPEMAVELIMEDLRISREKALTVLAESKELGDILHEEERDVVEEVE